MEVDHRDPRAAYARLIMGLELLHRAIDRAAENPGLRDAPTQRDARARLQRLTADLTELTGIDHSPALVADGAGLGELFLAAGELLAAARAADWWHGERFDAESEAGRGGTAGTDGPYL